MKYKVIDIDSDIKQFKDVDRINVFKHKYHKYSDDIYTFDIEATSLFNINGKWQLFDKSIDDYSNIEKASCVYHCQFSVNNNIYMFSNIADFEYVLKKISNPFCTKFIYVHNLAFETEFLFPILRKYTITNMIARKSRQPITYRIEELNVEFRCSYLLTNLGLERSAEQYTSINKATGDLNYNVSRSPLMFNEMSEKEKYYCYMDCACVYEIIRTYRKKYGHIKSIPLTQTGEVRRELKAIVPKYHFKMIQQLTPTVCDYKKFREAFQGGITHANALWVNEYLENVTSQDIASSYPTAMCVEKFPMSKFKMIKKENIKLYPHKDFAIIYTLRFNKLTSKMYNHYIPFSKCRKCANEIVDNGRLVSADSFEITVTDVDFDLIKQCYDFKELEYIDIMVAKKEYLPKYLIMFILEKYGLKTKLKNIDGKEDIYLKSKQIINSMYGACCTNIVKSNVLLDSVLGWVNMPIDDIFIAEKLNEMKDYHSQNLFYYAWGVYVTAYCRRNLFERLIDNNYELDTEVVYYDTDSLKILNSNKHQHIFDGYNKNIKLKCLHVANHYQFDVKLFAPIDKHGVKHPLGYYEFDGQYQEFITLGAKRYCYRDDKGLHITVSGVGKQGVKVLNNDIHNFNFHTFFDYDNAHKMISCYNDEQPPFTFIDENGHKYNCKWESGVVLYPTTYQMSINSDFYEFLESLSMKGKVDVNFLELKKKHTSKLKI